MIVFASLAVLFAANDMPVLAAGSAMLATCQGIVWLAHQFGEGHE